MLHSSTELSCTQSSYKLPIFFLSQLRTVFGMKHLEAYVRLLGLRSFQPQFSMNLVQALALGLVCTNIFCKGYIRTTMEQGSRKGNGNEPLGFRDIFRNAGLFSTR